jgi:predicted peptidase
MNPSQKRSYYKKIGREETRAKYYPVFYREFQTLTEKDKNYFAERRYKHSSMICKYINNTCCRIAMNQLIQSTNNNHSSVADTRGNDTVNESSANARMEEEINVIKDDETLSVYDKKVKIEEVKMRYFVLAGNGGEERVVLGGRVSMGGEEEGEQAVGEGEEE